MYNGSKTDLGYKHARSIVDANYNKQKGQAFQTQPVITVNNLKRIKNFFDNFTGNPATDPLYQLYGGNDMRIFVDNTLKALRDEKRLMGKNSAQRERDNTHYIKPTKPVKVNGQSVQIEPLREHIVKNGMREIVADIIRKQFDKHNK